MDEYGFISSDTGTNVEEIRPEDQLKWRRVLEKYPRDRIRECAKLEKLVLKGLPSFLRHRLYWSFVHEHFSVDYTLLKSKGCGYEYQIDVDIQRTFRTHFMYKDRYGPGQCRLFHVLVAFANYVPAIGYCQGMSNIVGVVLMYFDEEECFRMLVSIMKKNSLQGLFDKTLSKMGDIIECQEAVFKECIQDIYEHLLKEGIDLSVYAYSWYLTLFTRFDIRVTLRIWDVFMFYDFSVLFYVAASLLKYFERDVFRLRDEGLVEFLGSIETQAIDPDRIIETMQNFLKRTDRGSVQKRMGIGKN